MTITSKKIQNKENEGFRVTGLVNVFEQNPDEPYVVVMSKVNGKSKLFPNSKIPGGAFAAGMYGR